MSSSEALRAPGAQGEHHAPGRLAELLAVGGLTLLLWPLSWLAQRTLGLSRAELAVGFTMFHAAHFLNDPHFAVTYLLFYRRARAHLSGVGVSRAQHARYLISGVVVPIALALWAAGALALRSAQGLGWMVQLMFLLVGWHYAKQGFGVLAVLSGRRGMHFSARERALILAHCYLAWAHAWASPASAAGLFEEKGVVYWAPAHPEWLARLTLVLFLGSGVGLAHALFTAWRRLRTLPYLPLTAFLVTVWWWTVHSTFDRLVQYVIPALHALQYGYFVWLMRRNEARAHEGPPTFGPPVRTRLAMLAVSAIALGWVIFRGAPQLLDALVVPAWGDEQGELGPTPFFAAFFLFVNIHHYFLDHAIWRREHAETRYLFMPDHAPAESGAPSDEPSLGDETSRNVSISHTRSEAPS